MIRFHVFLCLSLLAFAVAAQPVGEGGRARWEAAEPRQRGEKGGRCGPDMHECERAWRRMAPEERAAMRERMSPQEREQMRNRFLERHEQRWRSRGDEPRGGPPQRRLSPEERQQLRDQIREANRDMPHHGRHEQRRWP